MTKELVKLKRECRKQEASGEILSPYMVSITFTNKPGYKNVDCETLDKAFKVAGRKDVSGLCIYDASGNQLINVWNVKAYTYARG